MSFVGLHTHSDYSLLDGASQLPDLIQRAMELGMPAIALTDHGVMYGAIELIKICRDKTIKPIIGNEMYVVDGDITIQERRRRKYHQVVLAKNNQGYKNLVKLTTISHLQGVQGKGLFSRPCINQELLEKYHEGLIVTSGCRAGKVPQLILQGKFAEARECAQWYKKVFKDDYYLEIQDHGYTEDRIVNVEIVKIGQELAIKVIATNDSHFTSCSDVEAHDALLCIQTGQLIEEEKRMRYSGTEYLKSAEEMAQLFRDHLDDDAIQEAIANTLEVADKIERYKILGEPRIPDYHPIPPTHTADTYVQEIARKGLMEKLKCQSFSEIDPVYQERLDYELKMIERMGFSTYFLVVWDYIKYARDRNIPVGPGRGSAAGSLVAYTMGITNIDPVHHGLLFERFLNPERKSMPDIDTDFCIERRDEVIQYVTEKYGTERVAQIITFNRLTSKSVLKDVARVLKIPYGDADKMAKMIPVMRGKPTKLKVMVSDQTPAPEFKEKYDQDPVVRRWLDMAMRIEGTNKTFGVHAAGVVISAEPLDEIVPLQKNNDGSVITQYFMEDLESLGLLKMDFLGLKNLTMVQNTIDLVQQTQNIKIDPDEITLGERKAQKILAKGEIKKINKEVEKTYKVLGKGDLEGIFQLESSGMKDVVEKLKPSCIEDISSILALYRPGPLDAGLIPKFIDRKHKRELPVYEHPILEPILEETYGVLVYQEQIMKIAQDLAGYSLGQADLLRRAMGKKKAEEMQKQRETFIDGATKNGMITKAAEKLFEQMVLFAEYCFNKSHSTAYAYVTYQTAYLKANYPVEYMAALLTANSGDQDKVQKYITNCQNMVPKIPVEGPDINRSEIHFTPDDGKILFGLSAIKNVGEGAIECILKARRQDGNFTSLAELCDRVDLRAVNSRALEALVKSGAFDKISPNRKQLVEYLPSVISWVQKSKEVDNQPTLFDLAAVRTPAPKLPEVKDFAPQEKLLFEKELLGFYVSEHPLKFMEKVAQNLGLEIINLSQLEEQKSKAKISVGAMLVEIKQVVTKKGDSMAILQLEDLSGRASAVVFPKTYETVKEFLTPDQPSIITGKVDKQDDRLQIIVEEIKILTREQLAAAESITPVADDEEESNEDLETNYLVVLQLTPQWVQNENLMRQLQAVLKEQSGDSASANVPVMAIVADERQQMTVEFGKEFWVQNYQAAVEAIKNAGFSAYIQTEN